jgi:hypothetical protein
LDMDKGECSINRIVPVPCSINRILPVCHPICRESNYYALK